MCENFSNSDCFARKLNEFLIKTGIKMTDLSRKSDVSYSTIISYFKENRQPSFPILRRLIKNCNINPEWLFLDRGEILLDDEQERRKDEAVKMFFAEHGVDLNNRQTVSEVNEVIRALKYDHIRRQIVRFLRVLMVHNGVQAAIKDVDDLIEFLKTTREVLSMISVNKSQKQESKG